MWGTTVTRFDLASYIIVVNLQDLAHSHPQLRFIITQQVYTAGLLRGKEI